MTLLTYTINKYSVLFLFVLVQCICLSQDTLFFKDKQKIAVLVKEVSPAEIKYQKMDLPDGPTYIVSKKDVEKIIYKNGYTEVIKSEDAPVAVVEQPFVVLNNFVTVNNEKINYNDTKNRRYYYLTNLIDRHPDPSRRERLMQSAMELKTLKKHQDGTRTGAIVFGGLAIGGALLYAEVSSVSYLGYVDPVFTIPPIVFGVLGAGLGAASVAININLKKKRHEFVDLYNQ